MAERAAPTADPVAPTVNGELALLIEQFDLAIRTPDDVARLKQLILQLAVMGKLVPQDPDDEPAAVLLERIAEASGSHDWLGRRPKLPPDRQSSHRYTLPSTWKWVRLAEIGEIVGGGTPRTNVPSYWADDGGIPWLTPADLYGLAEKTIGEGRRCVTESGLDNSSAKLLPSGSVLFSSRAPIGYVAIAANGLATNQGFKSIVPFLPEMNHYIYWFLKTEGARIDAEASGTTFKEVSGKEVQRIYFPLPPLAEQHRIVAKVDELMAAADELSGRLTAAGRQRQRFHTAALHQLTTAETPAQTAAAWSLLDGRFDALYDDPAAVDELKQAILQLAVMGRLVESNLEDEDVEFVKVGNLCEVRGGIQKSPSRKPDKHPTRYLTVAHVGWDRIDTGDPRYFEVSPDELPKWKLENGDVLVVEGNGSLTQIGRTAVFRGEVENCVHQNHVIRVRPNRDRVRSDFLQLSLISPQGRSQMIKRSQTSSGLYTLSTGRLKSVNVRVPPLAEQHRIVAKVDELFALADETAARAGAAEAARGRLLAALVGRGVG